MAIDAPRPLPAPALLPDRYRRTYLPEPDYSRPLLELTTAQRKRILGILEVLYGEGRARACGVEIERLLKVFYAHKTPEMLAETPLPPEERFSERDVMLITYGDLITSRGKTPLRALSDFLDIFMRGAVNTVHILPFFPYTSDRGFSIIDYEEVDPRLGTWEEIEVLSRRFRLMFDGVFNHASAKSRWFQRFLNGRPGYEEFFVAFGTKDAIDPDHLRLILRPRTSDLLTRFQTIQGPRWVWTTFSPDQVDLNYRNERVLLRVVEVLLYYVRQGADIIRLDAVTYIWRELGTRCAHLRQGHALVQLFRALLDVVAPEVALVTETNVPHEDNVSYLGDGSDEAQMVYNFALPPLVLHTFHAGDCERLRTWAAALRRVAATATYFNFLDSHDGIGLSGAGGLLTAAEIDALVDRAQKHGGLVSYRADGEGGKVPYELNVTWYSALNRDDVGEPQSLQIDRFLASRAIALVLMGVPGVYLPSLFGAKNDTAAVLQGSGNRSINRKTIDEAALFDALRDRHSWVHEVAVRFRRMVRRRIATPAFHPNAAQRVLDAGDTVFAVLRGGTDGVAPVLALTNVTAEPQEAVFPREHLGTEAAVWLDRITGRERRADQGVLRVALKPYEVVWLTPD